MSNNVVIRDKHGNVIEGATITRLPSAAVLARKNARQSVGLADRGRVPELVQELAKGALNVSDVESGIANLDAALMGISGALTNTEVGSISGVIANANRCLTIHANMVNAGITLADLTKGDDPEDSE